MQNVHGAFKTDCVNRAIGIALIVLNDFQNAGILALPGLSRRMLPPNWATLRAEPMVSLTASGNSRSLAWKIPPSTAASRPVAASASSGHPTFRIHESITGRQSLPPRPAFHLRISSDVGSERTTTTCLHALRSAKRGTAQNYVQQSSSIRRCVGDSSRILRINRCCA
jgi:hypothetical protein